MWSQWQRWTPSMDFSHLCDSLGSLCLLVSNSGLVSLFVWQINFPSKSKIQIIELLRVPNWYDLVSCKHSVEVTGEKFSFLTFILCDVVFTTVPRTKKRFNDQHATYYFHKTISKWAFHRNLEWLSWVFEIEHEQKVIASAESIPIVSPKELRTTFNIDA